MVTLVVKSSPQNENFNLQVRIKFLNLFLYSSQIKAEKFTDPNKVLLVLGRKTDAHREDCKSEIYAQLQWGK